MSIKGAHLAGDIGNSQEVEQGQQETIEHGQDAWSIAFADLTVVFA
jgi:hypothetical protein